MLETARAWSASVSFTVASCSGFRSRMLMFQALRTSVYLRPRPAATAHCSVKSGEISSMNPDRVHMGFLTVRGLSSAVQSVDPVDEAQRWVPLFGVDPERLRLVKRAVEVGDEQFVRGSPVGLAAGVDPPLGDGLGASVVEVGHGEVA